MGVDPGKTRKILVVHGVQTGKDEDLNQDKLIKELIKNRLGDLPLKFDVELYKYENINDEAQAKFQFLLNLFVTNPVGRILAKEALDLVGDVVISLQDGKVAAEIRQGLREKIVGIYDSEAPCYIVAHSLGTIYTFDVLNELMRDAAYFDRTSRRTWPVQGLITMGSPIGLDMFKIRGRKQIADLGEGQKWLRWVNYFDVTDPVVSGNIFGQQLVGYKIAEKYLKKTTRQGWVIRDRSVDTGKVWLAAHTAYWENPIVGDGLVDMITN